MAITRVHKVVRLSGAFLAVISSLLLIGSDIKPSKRPLIFLPGTQVGTVDSAENPHYVCRQCHYSTEPTRPVDIFNDWSGSMMAHSARDPIFYAALGVANKYLIGSGEFCIRCHSPMGWVRGHSEDYTGKSLTGTDFDGVQCDYCHRAGNPMDTSDATISLNPTYPVPGYGNGMHGIQRTHYPKRGPYDSLIAPHATKFEPFLTTGNMCGVCHDISNPFDADQITLPPYAYHPLERTYSEWLMSSYAGMGDSGTCQSCHMTDTAGYDCIYSQAPFRTNLARHDLTGGNTFVPDILPDFWQNLDTLSLASGKQRAGAALQRAAALGLQAAKTSDTVTATVTITNRTGHKLPTGYPEGRKMWIHLVGKDAFGTVQFESGRYDQDSARIVRDPQLKVYEIVRGVRESTATQYGVPPGPSLHFVLNDTVLLDNRIPPRGYTHAGFASRLAEPVGAAYADSQYWDVTSYALPSSVTQVEAELLYQTISRDYIEFLRNENIGNSFDWNSWGDKLYTSWSLHGKSAPVVMARTSNAVLGVKATRATTPLAFKLNDNYPNPFNPGTLFSFQIPAASHVTLTIYDLLGRQVAVVLDDKKPAGSYTATWDASTFPSGIYFYRLNAGSRSSTKKMLLIR
jgi:hypothetical protein